MKLSRLILFSFVIFSLSQCHTLVVKSWSPPYKSRGVQTIRVFLGESSGQTYFRSSGLITVYDVNDLVIKKAIDVLAIDLSALQAKIQLVPEGDFIEYKGKKYRGRIQIVPEAGSSSTVINLVPLEKYLLAVVPSEVPASWPLDALKAQAICARTYAVREMLSHEKDLYDVDTTTKTQVYGGMDKEHPNTSRAVAETNGIVAVYDSKPIQAFFHSNSGGMTESPEYVWGSSDIPYLEPVESNYCQAGDNYFWKEEIAYNSINSRLRQLQVGNVKEIYVLGRTPSGRVHLMEIVGENGSIKISGREFRTKVGASTIKSLRFGIQKDLQGFLVKGMGSGHGVGLSQWGSYGMAKEHFDYVEILKYYYQGIQLARISE